MAGEEQNKLSADAEDIKKDPNNVWYKQDEITLQLNSNEEPPLTDFQSVLIAIVGFGGIAFFLYQGVYLFESIDHSILWMLGTIVGIVAIVINIGNRTEDDRLYHYWVICPNEILHATRQKGMDKNGQAYPMVGVFKKPSKEFVAMRWVEAKRALSQTYHSESSICYHLEMVTETSDKYLIQMAFEDKDCEEARKLVLQVQEMTGIKWLA